MAHEMQIKQRARDLGFDLVGIAPAVEADGFERLHDWLAHGYAGDMHYMEQHAEARRHPAAVFPAVRSVIMLGLNYYTGAEADAAGDSAKVARYARGPDYHDVLHDKLNTLLDEVRVLVPGSCGRGVVDTAPLLERDFARRAGLGWFGKNTMLLNKRLGSYFFLAALLLDVELQPDPPHHASHCGTCTACLDACPTHAFVAAGVLDSRRCISYLTIELRTPIADDLRPALGNWVFGCDICQEVCPWNHDVPEAAVGGFSTRADLMALDPVELLSLSDAEFRSRFRHTALFRTKRRGLLRNAALVLGNCGTEVALPSLRRALDDPEPMIRDAAAWAIAQIQARQQAPRTAE